LIGAAYAQLSAVSYGVSDFVGGVASRRVAALRVMLVTYPVATVLLGVMAATAGGPVRPGALLWGSLYGISQAIGVYWFYAAVAAGPISVVSPLAAVLNAAVPSPSVWRLASGRGRSRRWESCWRSSRCSW
jgi:uncharacterized membrane protein